MSPSPSVRTDALHPVIAQLSPQTELGERYEGSIQRLLDVDLDHLLAGFRSPPGEQAWIGEHIGKWLDAASLIVEATGHRELHAKLEAGARALMATQGDDGYLGTYPPGVRFGAYPEADWDVWVHKYVLIGLLSYHRVSGDNAALKSARRVGDLLIATFGRPDGADILGAGTHVGMAATSVLGPIAQLHRATGESSYLEFAREIVEAWDRPGGPQILSVLLDTGLVSQVGNGKAYEMLSNIVGLADLAQADPDPRYLEAADRAWHDVRNHHLYISGTASFGEHFHHPDELPDSTSVNMGETCVTVTWLQLTRRLFHLTGRAEYAAEIERTMLNHLSAAQTPDGSAWCYYTPLAGRREYGSGTSCCISSGPRGMALAPSSIFSATETGDELVVSLYQSATAVVELGRRPVTVTLTTAAPYASGAALQFEVDGEAEFSLRLRRPDWATSFGVEGAAEDAGWVTVPSRRYRTGDRLDLDLGVGMRAVHGAGWNTDRTAMTWGPLVLAYDGDGDAPDIFDVFEDLPAGTVTASAQLPWSVSNAVAEGGRRDAVVLPFARAGLSNRAARVWVNTTAPRIPLSVFHGATEIRSSGDLGRGSVADYDPMAFASTADDEGLAWFGLELPSPVTFGRVVVAHGRSLVHGGWFDRSRGVPVIEVRATADAEWTPIAEVTGYPETDDAGDGGLVAGQRFEVALADPVSAVAIRVVGHGSSGEYPRPDGFVSCAMLTAYES